MLGEGGAKYFFSGPKLPPRIVLTTNRNKSGYSRKQGTLAFLDFHAFLLLRFFLLFCSCDFPCFFGAFLLPSPRILGAILPEKQGKSRKEKNKEIPKSKEGGIREGRQVGANRKKTGKIKLTRRFRRKGGLLSPVKGASPQGALKGTELR